jgi:uncharacterized Zn finger protein
MSDWYPFPPSRPRKVEGGLRARSKRGVIGETWWSRRFIDLLESFQIGSRLQRGRHYARAGQVIDLKVTAGKVRASVQGSREAPYRVRIETPPLPAKAWKLAEEAMADRAAFAAKLLAGEMPHDIEEAFAAAGVSLFPASVRELASSCSCPDWSNPCKHIAAVYYLLAESFDDDPFLILAWRGRTRDALLGRLRALRAAAPGGAAAPAPAPGAGRQPSAASASAMTSGIHLVIPEVESPPLAECVERFWSAGDLEALRIAPRAAELPDALLRQLDPPPVGLWGRGLNELLAPAYGTMTQAAERRALDPEP